MIRCLLIAVVVVMWLGGACTNKGTPVPDGRGFGGRGAVPPAQATVIARYAAAPSAPARPGGPGGRVESADKGEQVPVPQERKLIRNASARLEVRSVDAALNQLRALTGTSGGYATEENRSRDEYGVGRGAITCRIPAGRLDSLTARLTEIGTIEEVRIFSSDITEQYFNLEISLRNRRVLESRLLALVGRPGNRLSELLETERELARVRGEIDQMEGRQRFWDNHVALSTLSVTVHEPAAAVAGAEGGPWTTLKRSFSQAADNFIDAVAGMIALTGSLVPVVVALVAGVWIVARLWRWRRRRRTARAFRTQPAA